MLGDPIAPPEAWGRLIDDFLAREADVVFFQATRPTVQLLAARGFTINEFGLEARLDLRDYDFVGSKKRNLRTAPKQAADLGHVTHEIRADDVMLEELRSVSQGWRRARRWRAQPRFLVRPVALDPGVRTFLTRDATGRAVAFGQFDPIWRDGQVKGYLFAVKQALPEAGDLASYGIMRRAIETFAAEGVHFMSLGLAPGAGVEDKEFAKSWLFRRVLMFAYHNPLFDRFVYSIRGLAKHKLAYADATEQTYVAFRRLPALPRLLKFAWVMRLV